MIVDTIPFVLASGKVLRNGARILQSRIHSDKESFVVLCEKTAFCKEEFVTWRTNAVGDCFWGHYNRDIEAATKDFLER